MSFRNKGGHVVSDKTIGWIMWIAVAVAVGFAIRMMVSKFA